MSELNEFVLALVVGVGLGAGYFAGLWWTVRRVPTTRHPLVLTLGSFVVRAAVFLLGLLLFARGDWVRLAGCLVGFILIRSILAYRWRPQPRNQKGDERSWS